MLERLPIDNIIAFGARQHRHYCFMDMKDYYQFIPLRNAMQGRFMPEINELDERLETYRWHV